MLRYHEMVMRRNLFVAVCVAYRFCVERATRCTLLITEPGRHETGLMKLTIKGLTSSYVAFNTDDPGRRKTYFTVVLDQG